MSPLPDEYKISEKNLSKTHPDWYRDSDTVFKCKVSFRKVSLLRFDLLCFWENSMQES